MRRTSEDVDEAAPHRPRVPSPDRPCDAQRALPGVDGLDRGVADRHPAGEPRAPGSAPDTLAQHAAILAAIDAHDPDGASAAMAAHLEGVAEWWRAEHRAGWEDRRPSDGPPPSRPRRLRGARHRGGPALLPGPPRAEGALERGDPDAARAADVPRRGQRLPPARGAARRRRARSSTGSTRTGTGCTTSASGSTTWQRPSRRSATRAHRSRSAPVAAACPASSPTAEGNGVRIECTEFVRSEDVDAVAGWLAG